MIKKLIILAAIAFAPIFSVNMAHAHFGILIPSKSMVLEKKDAGINLDLAFAHPFSQSGMNMERPAEFFVSLAGKKTDLLPGIRERKYLEKTAWQAAYNVARPGVYQFAFVPQPYFEPAEDCFIIHYTKTVIGAYGEEDGWEEPLGLPVEIVPLSRPFGNYNGNTFSGVVLQNGKPVANIPVEVENLNAGNGHKAPNPYFETQVVHTDANGVFTFGIPWAGWWGFAALCGGDDKIELNSQPKAVELGGVIWVQFSEPEKSR